MSSATPVPAVQHRYGALLESCEQRLREAAQDSAAAVAEPALSTLRAGGKRVRPLLVFCCAPSGALEDEETRERLLDAAAAVELVHMATLVHDDLLDGATLRRGRPTVSAQRGPAAAVQTGDFLFARAFSVLTRAGSPQAVAHLAGAALDLSQGELDQQRSAFDLDLAEAGYLARCRRKTAALFAVACRLGAELGGAGPEAAARLAGFGEGVGMAFQIFDDILDLAGDPASTGKRRGTDLRDGTTTLPLILAMAAEPALRARIAAAAGEDAPRDAVEALCDDLAAHAGSRDARARALAYVATARAGALEGPVDGADVDALTEIADGVVDRYS
ncbi:MAG: polyprenyl synthetase family protein [Miltoncostaeaceae bacterium]